jgi:two-component system phosphate regulon sensor histidine kinase PhoR
VLHLVNPDDLDTLAQRWPDLAERISPTVRSVLLLDEAMRPLRVVAHREDDDRSELVAWVTGARLGLFDLAKEEVGAHSHWHGTVDGRSVLLSYFTRESAGRRYYVVLEADVDYIQRELLPKLFDDPLARDRFNITDESHRLVVGRSLRSAGGFVVSAPFPTTLYNWQLSVAPRRAPELAARSRRRGVIEGSYVGASLLVILAGVSFLLFAARQEEQLNTLKSDFIATVSHELKTPLSLIRMFGEMLAGDRATTPEKRAQYLDIIVRESERLSALIENVLDFARLEQGRAAYEFTAADLGATVRRDVEAFRFRENRDRPALVVEIADGIAPVRLDARAMQVLLFNLLDNAFKYAGDTDAVYVRARQEGARAVVEVEDRGPGIDPEDARKIFERFYRGRAVRSGGPRGTGIGLSLVKHIARAHGGDVTVLAASPRGTVFRVTIPVGG